MTVTETATLQRAVKAVLPHVGGNDAPEAVRHVLVDFTNGYVYGTDRYSMARARFHMPEVDISDRVIGTVLLSKDDAIALSKFSEKMVWEYLPVYGDHPIYKDDAVLTGFTVGGDGFRAEFNHVFEHDYPNIYRLIENLHTEKFRNAVKREYFALSPNHLDKLAPRHVCRTRADRNEPFVFYAPEQVDDKVGTVRIEFAGYLTVLIVEIGPITGHVTE